MKIEVVDWYTRDIVRRNGSNCYVFGENNEQQGTKSRGFGQAVIRNLPNTFGFRTKTNIYTYWSDDKYHENIQSIEEDIKKLLEISKIYTICFPAQGIGTGLSKLPQKAQKSFLYLYKRLLDVFGYNNIANLKSE